jgi:hypothetical protein
LRATVALPVGLLPVLVGALTVGVALPTTVVAHRLSRRGRPFGAALGTALPLALGRALLGRARGLDPETALRFAT